MRWKKKALWGNKNIIKLFGSKRNSAFHFSMAAQQAGLCPSRPNTVSVIMNTHPQMTERERLMELKTA